MESPVSEIDIREAVEKYALGVEVPAPTMPNLERRLATRYVADVSLRLSEEEIRTLSRATQLREEALDNAHAGEFAVAEEKLARVEDIVENGVTTTEGRLTARSYHAAVVAFLQFRTGEQGRALASLEEALDCCLRLSEEFGHTVSVRRIHLARNVVRVRSSREEYTSALGLAHDLIEYIRHDASWPLGADTSPPASSRLDDTERRFVTDQTLSEIPVVASALRSGEPSEFADPFDQIPKNRWSAWRGGEVLRLCRLATKHRDGCFVEEASEYFEAGKGYLPMTWGKLENLFEDVTGVELPEEIGERVR